MTSTPTDFAGLHVAALESRRAEEMARLIERQGGVPHVSPSMREVPLEENPAAIEFANQLMTGQIDAVIFTTGVGVDHLLAATERHVDHQRFLACLADTVLLARGPKPLVALKKQGLAPSHRVPEPNTWREVLGTIDAHMSVANQTIAIQEYGKSNASLIAGLEARGAKVVNLKIYRWELPEDCAPLEANIRALVAGDREVLLFTSAHQVVNMMAVAEKLQLVDALKQALSRAVVASIGPTTSDMLRAYELSVDVEPVHSKMGQLVLAAAQQSHEISRRKQRIETMPTEPLSPVADESAPWYDSPFMKACRHEVTDVTPVWLMRQAGRYMEEYRQVRKKMSFLELCRNPQMCSEVMCTAVQRLGVDAAIIFSDLLPILEPMGLDLEFAAGEGPVIHNPVREAADVDRVIELESIEPLDYVVETVRQTRSDLPEDLPLIGFAGAPFTLASYAIEGGSSRSYLHTKRLMYRDEGAWRTLMERLARSVVRYLNAQIAAGAQCVQLFDSWAGCLSYDDYRHYVMPYVQQVIRGLTPGVPVINFATGNSALLPLLAEAGGEVIGVDWRVRLDSAWDLIGHGRSIQGNLDPTVLLADRDTIARKTRQVLRQAAGRPGHIFNLGHGVLQQTPVENAIALVDLVHELSAK